MKSKNCLCKCENSKKVLSGVSPEGTRFTIIRCNRCGLERTSDVYDDRSYLREFARLNNQIDPKEELRKRMRWGKELINEIVKIKKGGKLLDIGCFIGGFVKLANIKGFKAEGIDLNIDAIKIGRKFGLKLYAGDFISYPIVPNTFKDIKGFKKESYDVITMNSVLQHISNPQPFLKKAYSLLKPNGILGISEPNCDGLLPKLIKEKWYAWSPNEKLWHFSPKTLISSLGILEKRLRLIKIRTTNIEHSSKNPVINFILSSFLDLIKSVGMGDKMIVLMKKER